MKADLYIRVSTDEQAERGYSQRDQEERLRKYCEIKKIDIRNVIYEDYSAKTFLRPAWKKLLEGLKKRKNQIDLVLFTKWDRFSRNAADAFQMIIILRKLGVEPSAIEQPLDMDIPENKIMLGIFLTAPEVENDRRAINVRYGMRRAVKEGRWMNGAPLGYINRVTPEGKKYIAIEQPYADILKWSFETIAERKFHIEQIYLEAKKKGLPCSKGNFWNLIRNPVFCGKIFLRGYKDEPDCIIRGNHEPIISESLYYDVQDFLDGKKKVYKTSMGSLDELVMRGQIICPSCGKLLTGSASRGRGGRYFYYHCVSPCKVRFKSEIVNTLFSNELTKFIPKPGMTEVYCQVVNSAYKLRSSQNNLEIKKLNENLIVIQSNIQKARTKFLTDQIERNDYYEFKKECESEMERVEARLIAISGQLLKIDGILKKAVSNLSNLAAIYMEGDNIQKRKLISSIFPEKLVFDGERFRTKRLNKVIELIFNADKGFDENKNGQTEKIIDLSTSVARPGFEPRQTVPKTVVLPLYYQAIRYILFEWVAKIGVYPNCSKYFKRFISKIPSCLIKIEKKITHLIPIKA